MLAVVIPWLPYVSYAYTAYKLKGDVDILLTVFKFVKKIGKTVKSIFTVYK